MMALGISSVLISCSTTEPKPNTSSSPAVLGMVADITPHRDALEVGEEPTVQSEDCLEPSQCHGVTLDNDPDERTAVVNKVYPKLEYGKPQPFVCDKPILPKGKLENRPNLQVMWEYYIHETPDRVWEEVGGIVEINGCLPDDKGGWLNACTVRLSHMLNKAGHKLPRVRGKTVSGGTGDQYFFRLDDIQAYLGKAFGPADIELIDVGSKFIDLPDQPGLLLLKFPGGSYTGHATIWNGAGTVDGSNVAAFAVYFWELPCYEPQDRLKAEARSQLN